MSDCYMPNAMTIAMSFSMTTEHVGHLIIYVHYLAMTLHIAVTEKRLLSYYYGFDLYLRLHLFQFADKSGHRVESQVTVISVYRHIMASIKISNHHLFWFAIISRHRSITLITVYFVVPAYHDII
jgi:hypothetical protein